MTTKQIIQNNIDNIDVKLDRLLQKGANDEKLVTKKRKLQDELRQLEAGESV